MVFVEGPLLLSLKWFSLEWYNYMVLAILVFSCLESCLLFCLVPQLNCLCMRSCSELSNSWLLYIWAACEWYKCVALWLVYVCVSEHVHIRHTVCQGRTKQKNLFSHFFCHPFQVNEWNKNDERLLAAVEHGEAEKVASLLAKKGANAVKLDSEGKSA